MKRLTVAITGASGVLYSMRLLKYLLTGGYEVDLIISEAGHINIKIEMDIDLSKTSVPEFLTGYCETDVGKRVHLYSPDAITAPIASGSVGRLGMVVIPCSMKTMAGIANGSASNLIERAADVTLKEGRPLVVVPRETPLNTIQLENMLKLARAGAHVVPAMPAFYQKPKSFDDLADFIAGRVLNLLGISDHNLFRSWGV